MGSNEASVEWSRMPRTYGPRTKPSATYSVPDGSPTPRTTRPLTRKLPMYDSTRSPIRTTRAFIRPPRFAGRPHDLRLRPPACGRRPASPVSCAPESDLVAGERCGDGRREAGFGLADDLVARRSAIDAEELDLRARRDAARGAEE